jgi:hypothetical protein
MMAALTASAMLGLAPSLATAEDVQQQLQQMQERLQQMEDRQQATDDQLDAANKRVEEQSALIESSGLAETRGASSGLGCLVCELTIGGWVAGSYFYNINDPNDAQNPGGVDSDFVQFTEDGIAVIPVGDESSDFFEFDGGLENTNQGFNGKFYPMHPDHNSFAVDQVWMEVEREINEEHRAGFRTDFVYGKTAALMGGPNNRDDRDDSALYIHQAYVQYSPPIGLENTVLKFGKFATPIGAEVLGTVYNWNITRGNVWNLLEPIDHIGVSAGGPIGESGFDWMIGGANGFNTDDADRNDRKSVLGHLGWASDTFSVGVNGIWGGEQTGFDGDESGVVNALIRWNPSERFGMYVNGDFGWLDDPSCSGAYANGGTLSVPGSVFCGPLSPDDDDDDQDPMGWGVSLAGRFGITERTGIALRGEYVEDKDGFFGFTALSDSFDTVEFGEVVAITPAEVRIYGVTATVDHLLTDHLMVRAEARWDWMQSKDEIIDFDDTAFDDDFNDDEFFENDNFFDDLEEHQIVVGLEVIYHFNKFGGE